MSGKDKELQRQGESSHVQNHGDSLRVIFVLHRRESQCAEMNARAPADNEWQTYGMGDLYRLSRWQRLYVDQLGS